MLGTFAASSLSFTSLAILLQTAGVVAQSNPCAVCDDVHFFLARGNNEPYPGRQAALVEATCQDLSGCGYENLYYSALYTDLYCQTAYDGAVAGLTQIRAYSEQCPNSKLILAGYSQGGQIAGDILGGGGGYSFNGCHQPWTPALAAVDDTAAKQIAAVIIFGDVRHTANEPYNYGNGSQYNGWFPRNSSQLAALEPYTPIMRNWCDSVDPICAANMTGYVEEDHLSYYDRDSDAAASWIKSVASLTDDSSFTTAIPTSLSGTVQNYATVPTGTPTGTVTLDTTYTDYTSVAACTSSTYSLASVTMNGTTSATMSSSASASTSMNGTMTLSGLKSSVFPMTMTMTASSSGSSNGSAATSTGVVASTGGSSSTFVRADSFGLPAVFLACALLAITIAL